MMEELVKNALVTNIMQLTKNFKFQEDWLLRLTVGKQTKKIVSTPDLWDTLCIVLGWINSIQGKENIIYSYCGPRLEWQLNIGM